MGKKTGTFTEGQHVFAKVKGYSPWPAKITKVISKYRYGVYFYGTGETASVKSEDLDAYDAKNIGRFNTERQIKKPEYKEAVDQIQSAIEGNDPAPINAGEKEPKEEADTTAELEHAETDNSADESQLHIAEDVPKSTPQPQKRKVAAVKVKTDVTVPVVVEPESKENDEKVSRSGRKIKEKKMNTDEMDPDEMFTQARKRVKVDDGKPKPAPYNAAIEEFRASKLHVLQDPVKKASLEHQYEMINVIQEIKLALGLEKQADIDRSLELMETFKDKVLPYVTALMLLKYPNTVDTVRRLRKYVGNTSLWTLNEAEALKFSAKAETIRVISSAVYDQFKTHFELTNDDSSFWSKFADQQKSFQEKYNSLSPEDLFEGFTYDELDSFLNNHITGDADESESAVTSTQDETAPIEEESDKPTDETSQMEAEPEI